MSVCPGDEYLLVGGGLQNALIALALLARRPETRLTLVEREPNIGGNHTWCFHAGDTPPQIDDWLERLVERRWPAHEVRFSRYRRRLDQAYCAVTSARLHTEVMKCLSRAPHARLVAGTVRNVEAGAVELEDGRQLSGQLIVDARGPDLRGAAAGYQKFLGLEVEVARGSAPALPILMDATVPQLDGFRFMYVLPLDHDRVLLEDTYYSTEPLLDVDLLRQRIFEYARESRIEILREVREERGVLPIPTSGSFEPSKHSPVRAGYRGGFFHPTTGYSFPIALRFACHLASLPVGSALGAEYQRLTAEHRRQYRYCVWLNRLLFGAFAPERRREVLERFYRLPLDTIRRFYALQMSPADRARILCGRPPPGFSLSRLLSGGQPA